MTGVKLSNMYLLCSKSQGFSFVGLEKDPSSQKDCDKAEYLNDDEWNNHKNQELKY